MAQETPLVVPGTPDTVPDINGRRVQSGVRIAIRSCDYQTILDGLLAGNPCDAWIDAWSEANSAWIRGHPYNLKARAFVDDRLARVEAMAQQAYDDCLAGNPVEVVQAQGLSLRLATGLAGSGRLKRVVTRLAQKDSRLSIRFGGMPPVSATCPPVSEAVISRDDYDITWFGADLSIDGQRNARLALQYDGRLTQTCPDYEDYVCHNAGRTAAEPRNTIARLEFSVARLYEIGRALTRKASLPEGIDIDPYDPASASCADAFMDLNPAQPDLSPLYAWFVFEYENLDTGEIVCEYPRYLGFLDRNGRLPLVPDRKGGGGTGAKVYSWFDLAPDTPPAWGDWRVRCLCLATGGTGQDIEIRHPDLLMSAYPQPGGELAAQPAWRSTVSVVHVPGMTDGAARWETRYKLVYANHSYRCRVTHLRVVEGIGMLCTIAFSNDTKFDFHFGYRAGAVVWYLPEGSFTQGPQGLRLFVFHLPPYATRTFKVLIPLDGYWCDRNFLGWGAPMPWRNPGNDTLKILWEAVPVKPDVAASLLVDVRNGDAGTIRALADQIAVSNLAANWHAPTHTPPASVLDPVQPCSVLVVESGVTAQRLGWSYDLKAVITYRAQSGALQQVTQYYDWVTLAGELGMASATQVEIPLAGGYRMVRNTGWWGGATAGYCTHGMVERCDYWDGWDDFIARVEAAVRALAAEYFDVVSVELNHPYLGFDFSHTTLNGEFGPVSGIVASVSESAYPARVTLRV